MLAPLDPNQAGFGFSPKPQYSTGDTPLWENPIFADVVLGRSLDDGKRGLPPPPKLTVGSLVESINLVMFQTRFLFEDPQTAGALKQTLGRIYSALERAAGMTKTFSAISDMSGFFELLTTFVAQVKTLTPGASIIVPGGFQEGSLKRGTHSLMMYVLHCDSFEEFTLAICSTGDGLEYHPARIDPATGATQYNSPLLLRKIPAHKIRDGSVWFVLLRAALFPDAKYTSALLYQTVYPFLNNRPILANLSSVEATGGAQPSPPPSLQQAGRPPVPPIPARWLTPPATGDPYGHELVMLAATVALQLAASGQFGAMPQYGGGFGAPFGAPPAGGAPPLVPSYSSDGVELLLKQQLLNLGAMDLRMALEKHGSVPVSAIELLSRAARRLSASSPRLASGAATLAPSDLHALQGAVERLDAQLNAAKAAANQRMPLPPPASPELKGSALFPLLDDVAASPNVENLAGDAYEPPIVMPVELTAIPETVANFAEVSNALQRASEVCTILANQRELVADSYALRASLLGHLFLRVLPLPLPIGRADRKMRCFWAKSGLKITHDTQAEILRWLFVLARHYSAASLSIPLAPQADATRMLVFAAIVAIADAVLRLRACDVPSHLSLHYAGENEGPSKPFALEMRHLEIETERAQFPYPHLAASRTILLDYFRSCSVAASPDRHIFRFERTMGLGEGERQLLTQLCAQLAFPRTDKHLSAYLSNEDPSLAELYPELLAFRDIVYLCKLMTAPSADNLPELRAWTPADARLSWRFKEGTPPEEPKKGGSKKAASDPPLTGEFIVTGFGAEMKSMTWVDSTGEYAAAKNKSFLDRLLGKGGFRPRLPPSSAEASVLAGAKVDTEDDVLHLRHLPDFGGALRASDVEYMLQALLAPYLRVPLLLRFFADPMRTSALAKPELQQMLDAALYEPGEWHPDVPKVAPTTVPTMDRSVLATPAGLLFNELTHSPAASVAAIVTIVENALDLDAGRYVKAGSSSAILYAIRLACRIEAFLTYLLSPKADEVRGLRMMSTADFGGVSPAKTKLLAAANTLRRKLMDHGLPVLQGWYARLRRDGMSRDACTVAAHMAFIYGDYPAVNDTPAAALKTEPLPGTPEAAAAAAAGEPCPVDARFTMMMLSTRVFLNVNHDFEIEPDVMTGLMGARTRKDRKRKVEVSAMMNTAMGELGYAPLDVFDLWQRHLHRVLAWLKANPEQASDIMEAIVRLLSGRDKGIKTQGGTRLVTREWASMKFTGCDGRYMPNSAATVANPARAAVARAGWGSENDAEADAAARSGGYVAWLRVKVSAAAETEINVQLGEMTLKRHHMQLLDASVCAHPDFAAVFGDTSTRGRHQCAEVKRSQRRRWMRLLGTRHDVQIWDADDRPPPSPGTALVSGLLAQWLEETLRPIKVAVPLLAHPEAPRLNLVEAHDTYAKLSVVVEGVLKELVIYRFPAVLNVFNVTEHGRKWVRELVYTSDTARCYGDPIAGGGFQGAVVRKPRPHWTAGDMAVRSEPQSTLVIMRQAANVQANAPNATQIFVPTRQLNGMMPEALLSQYLFWRDSAGQTLVGHPMPKGDEEQDYTGKVVAKAEAANAAGGASGAAAAGSPERPMPKGDSSQNQRLHLAGKEEVTVTCQRGGSVIRRTLCDEKGSPIAGESRRLISTLGVDASSPYGKMVALLERVEDLAHVLVWSLPQKEIVDTANNPFAKASQAIEAAATDTPSDSMAANPFASMAASVSKGVAAIAEQVQGPDSEVPVGLIELPRLNLAFEAKKGPDGLVRMYSRENPGLYIGTLEGPRASHLLSGLPHALVLLNEEGDASVLLSALAKPIRLADPDSALSAQMLLARASKKWLSNLPTVTHFLYSVHRSQAFLTPPTLSATLNLLVLKWLARDFEAVFHLAPACAVDGALSPDELQLWQCVMALEDDVEPEAHACRLRLSLATRSCAAMVAEINWTVPQQLALYLNKLQFIPASCQLAAPDELILLRDYGAELPETRARIAFLDAAIDATLAKEASANNPFMAGQMPAPTLQANYPARPKYVEFDVQMDAPALIMAPEALVCWQKKLSSMSYSRPDEETGLKALKVISDWLRPDVIRLDSDSKGFWLLYEMFTSSINLKILMDDSTFALGSLLLRLAAKGAGDELLPILRLMETNQAFANEMPKFKDTRSKGMITGTMFKGKAGKGMPEEIHKALTNLLPRLPGGGKFLEYPLYSPPQSVPMPALRDLRTIHRTWLNPTSLGFMQEQRPVPPAFLAAAAPGALASLVLAPLDPMSFISQAAAAGAGGTAPARPPTLTVERHPSATTVVARKMNKRILEDLQWFFAQGNSSGPPRLLTFEVDMGTGFGGQLPPVADLQARENLVKRLLAALEQLYKQDMKSADEQFPHVQALVIEGGASAPEAVRRARALAQLAGCELRPSMELLCALLMSTQAEAEIKVLNPLLSDAEVEQVFSALTALLLLYSRAQLLSRAIVLCKKLVDSLAALVREASRGGKPAPEALALAADAQAIGDQLGAMISTRRAHMQLPGASTPGAPAPTARLDPRILVFEFCAGIVLRPPQVHLLDKLVRCARSGGSVCHQMLMGEGKTTTVSPLLALMLADGTQLVMQVVPAPLLRFTLQVMRGVFRSGPLRKTVATFAFDRRTVVDENLLLAAHLAIQQGAIMVSTPASVKAFLLKLLELLHLLDTGQYPRMHMSLGQKARKLFGFKVPPEAGFDKPFLKAQAARAVQMLQYWRGAVAVIDEVDIVLHPLKSELNWPLGDRHPLDFNPTRWEMPWYLLNGLLMAVDWKNDASAASPTGTSGGTSVGGKEATVLERLHHAINTGLQQRVMQRVPHVILLSDMFYVNTLKPILADWLMLYLRKNGLRDVTDEQAIKCLLNGKITVQVQSALSDRHVKMLNLGCDWLGFLMPHVIRKISRVHYGLLKPQEMAKMKAEGGLPRSRRYLAVPFVGKDAPSHASEFAHPDVAIGLTILAYRYEGLRLLDFGPALQLLRQVLSEEAGPMLKRPSSIMWIQWMGAVGRKVRGTKKLEDNETAAGRLQQAAAGAAGTTAPATARKASKSIDLNKDGMVDSMERGHALDAVVGVDVSEGSTDILPLHLLDVSDVEYMAMLYELLSRKPEPIKFYLEELVFPDTTAHQPMKLSANGQDVGGAMLFSRRIGFSGTPSGLLPLEMGDCVYSMGDDAKMLKTLTDPLIVSQQFMPAAWDVPTLLEAVVAHQPPAHALIDTGALVTGMSNLDVAHFLLKRLPADKYDGVVYLEPGGHKKILLRGTAGASSTMDMERCGLPKERRFSFFDQVHTTGMDIPQGASACAILTLGKDMVWRDYAQGAYRMRGIGKGQTILLFVIPEVQRLMASETALGAGTTRDVRAAQIAALPEQERRRQELEAVASWLVINSMKSERVQFELWCLHCSQNVWRKKAKNGLVAGHANFSDAREGKGASALERRMLEVFREGVERDISNSVPVATDTRQTIASLAQQYAELCDEMHEIKAIESVQAMLAGYAPELDVPTESHTEKANEAAAFDQEQEQEQEQGTIGSLPPSLFLPYFSVLAFSVLACSVLACSVPACSVLACSAMPALRCLLFERTLHHG